MMGFLTMMNCLDDRGAGFGGQRAGNITGIAVEMAGGAGEFEGVCFCCDEFRWVYRQGGWWD